MSLLDDVIAEREQFISIKDILLNISFNNNEPLYDVAVYLSVMYDCIDELDIYHFDEFNFFKNEQISNHFELLLDKVLDNITIGSGRDWAYSGKYSSFGDYWGDGEGLLKTLNSYPYSYFKKADVNNNELLSRLVSFDAKTPKDQLADAHTKIADLKSQLAQVKAELADKPADSVTLSNTDMQNIKKVAIRQFNRSLATALIELDYQSNLRKGDIVNFIMPYMKELAFILADKDEKKADHLTVSYNTLYDNHLQGLEFKQGRQSNSDKNKVNIDLLFKKQLPTTG